MVNKGKLRRQQQALRKEASTPRVVVPVPEEFRDIVGEPWGARGSTDLGFLDVLIYTVRHCPVKTVEESERGLDLVYALQAAVEQIDLSKQDYDWLMGLLKEHAHNIWLPPDAAYLRRFIEQSVEKAHVVGQNGAKEVV